MEELEDEAVEQLPIPEPEGKQCQPPEGRRPRPQPRRAPSAKDPGGVRRRDEPQDDEMDDLDAGRHVEQHRAAQTRSHQHQVREIERYLSERPGEPAPDATSTNLTKPGHDKRQKRPHHRACSVAPNRRVVCRVRLGTSTFLSRDRDHGPRNECRAAARGRLSPSVHSRGRDDRDRERGATRCHTARSHGGSPR